MGDGVQLTDEQRLDWLRLIRSDNVSPRGIMAQTPQGYKSLATTTIQSTVTTPKNTIQL